jgi:hypothetical protein
MLLRGDGMRALHTVASTGLLLVACQQAPHALESEPPPPIVIPNSDWERFISELDRSFERSVPEARGDGLVAIKYFCTGHRETKKCVERSPAGQLGLLSGDRLVAANGTRVGGPAASAKSFLHEQMLRSAKTCSLSLELESQDRTRKVSARCG